MVNSFLSQTQLKTLVSVSVLCRLDYCNGLYYGLPSKIIKSLQQVQNSALRLVLKGSVQRYQSLDPLFLKVHWLKIRERIIYKILLSVYNCLRNNGPNELREMLQFNDSARTMQLQVPQILTPYGNRSFSYAGPKLWNILPSDIKHLDNVLLFKKRLKSFLLLKEEHFQSLIDMK